MATEALAKELAEKDYYFNSYSHYGIHMEMLKDRHRTESYRDAILRNESMFKGKIVLDVGCGTSILSMFAAKAGAKHVIGVDCSSIAVQARAIVAENGFSDKITILQGKIEEISLPDGIEHVDIIISEWMGYFLLYESMLQTVLYARDKFGNPAGVAILPSEAKMWIGGITDANYIDDKFNVWENVHGFDFSYFKRLQYVEPLIDTVDAAQLVTDTPLLFEFDINDVTEEQLAFENTMVLTAGRDDVVHGLSVHFDTPFTAGHDHVVLDTAPWKTPTHWRQTVLYLCNSIKMAKGEQLKVHLTSAPNADNKRDLDIHVKIDFEGKYQVSHFEQDFRLR